MTDLIDIFFVKEKAQIKVHIPVDTSHSLPLTLAYSFPLTWTLGMASKSGECTRGGRQVIKGQL